MHEDQLTEAMAAIAADIGPDAAEFSPPGQKNFLTEAALLGMAGTFLLSLFKGMAKKISEKIGEKIGDKIGGEECPRRSGFRGTRSAIVRSRDRSDIQGGG